MPGKLMKWDGNLFHGTHVITVPFSIIHTYMFLCQTCCTFTIVKSKVRTLIWSDFNFKNLHATSSDDSTWWTIWESEKELTWSDTYMTTLLKGGNCRALHFCLKMKFRFFKNCALNDCRNKKLGNKIDCKKW